MQRPPGVSLQFLPVIRRMDCSLTQALIQGGLSFLLYIIKFSALELSGSNLLSNEEAA
jgi:hypothetical protein